MYPLRFLLPSLALAALPTIAWCQASPTTADARVREIGQAYLRYQEKLRAIAASADESIPWWRVSPGSSPVAGREKVIQAQREFHDAIRGLLGTEPIGSSGRDPRFSFLPEAKQIVVAQIEQAYADRTAELRRETANVRLPSDGEKTRQFAAARERELLAVLTPAEFEQVELRNSASSSTVRQRFGEAIESEDEFRKIYVLQKAFDEKYPMEDALYSSRQQELMRQRSEAERKMMDEVRAAVGDERFIILRRAMDQDYQALRVIVRRLNLPDRTIDDALNVRDNYATQSMTINNEVGLNFNDRRTLLQDLGKEARKELAALLTPPGLEAYAVRNQWLRYLEQGMAFSTNPKDSSSSYISITSSTYMVMSSSTTVTSAGVTSGIVTISPGGASVRTPPPPASRASTENKQKKSSIPPAAENAPAATPKQ